MSVTIGPNTVLRSGAHNYSGIILPATYRNYGIPYSWLGLAFRVTLYVM